MIPARVLIPRIIRWLLPFSTLCLFAALALAAHPTGEGALSPLRLDRTDVVPPPVQITCPAPSADTALAAPPALQILWAGPDRRFVSKPFQYRYILLGPGSEFPVDVAVAHPESFRDYYANHPLGAWTGWESTDAHTTHARFSNLNWKAEYLFAVIALDRAGNYSPAFDLSANLLHFFTGDILDYYSQWPPVITMSGPGFRYTYPGGGFCNCESAEIRTQMRDHQRSTFRWSAEPGNICDSPRVRAYRWALDIADVWDETPRIDEETDLQHWSQKTADPGSAHLGPFAPGEVHRLYVWVEDEVGLISLGIVRVEVLSTANRSGIELTVAARRGGLADVSYSLPEAGNVEVAVYDVAGRRVATLEDSALPAGTHRLTWHAKGLGQGMYFYRLRVGSAVVTRPVLLLK